MLSGMIILVPEKKGFLYEVNNCGLLKKTLDSGVLLEALQPAGLRLGVFGVRMVIKVRR
jgi:hypothetical protein